MEQPERAKLHEQFDTLLKEASARWFCGEKAPDAALCFLVQSEPYFCEKHQAVYQMLGKTPYALFHIALSGRREHLQMVFDRLMDFPRDEDGVFRVDFGGEDK